MYCLVLLSVTFQSNIMFKFKCVNPFLHNRVDDDPEDDQDDSGGGVNDDLSEASENGDGDAV